MLQAPWLLGGGGLVPAPWLLGGGGLLTSRLKVTGSLSRSFLKTILLEAAGLYLTPGPRWGGWRGRQLASSLSPRPRWGGWRGWLLASSHGLVASDHRAPVNVRQS